MTATLSPTAARAQKLVAASERLTFDPFTEIDWNDPIDDRAFHLPPEILPLYGTPLWDAMTDEQQREYSRHETSALCGAGIWFENMLMQVILRHLVDLPVTDPSHRYLLIEVADECRHSQMFGEYIRRSGTPAYTPAVDSGSMELVRTIDTRNVIAFLLVLAVEELLDVANRATMKDERVHRVSRGIARIHVLEEARHVSFARTWLTETWPTLTADERDLASGAALVAMQVVLGLTVNPEVYETLELDGALDAIAAGPHGERVARSLTKLTGFLTELGVITDDSRPAWIDAGLVPAESDRA